MKWFGKKPSKDEDDTHKAIPYCRQGDIVLWTFPEKLPTEAKPVQSLVLAHGETTGHKHQLVGQVSVFEDYRNKYIVVPDGGSAQLVHEEHAPHTLEPGVYSMSRERSYDPFAKLARPSYD